MDSIPEYHSSSPSSSFSNTYLLYGPLSHEPEMPPKHLTYLPTYLPIDLPTYRPYLKGTHLD